MLKFVPTINVSTQVEKTQKEKPETSLKKVFNQFILLVSHNKPRNNLYFEEKKKGDFCCLSPNYWKNHLFLASSETDLKIET